MHEALTWMSHRSFVSPLRYSGRFETSSTDALLRVGMRQDFSMLVTSFLLDLQTLMKIKSEFFRDRSSLRT